MRDTSYTGTEFVEGFALLCLALWLGGALFFGAMAYLGNSRVGLAVPAANQTPVAESPATQ